MIKQHLRDLAPSPTLEINEKSRDLLTSGKTVFKFGFGQSPFPVPTIVQDALRENAHQKDYLPVGGLYELIWQFKAHHEKLVENMIVEPDYTIFGPGSKELIFLLQLATDLPLILPSPSWVSYAPQAEILQKTVHWLPTDCLWEVEADVLESYLVKNKIKEGLLLLNYPNNPSGASPSTAKLAEIAAVCRKNNITVISDEIYGLTAFDGHYKSIATYYPEGTIVTTGLSKWCGAGGWRVGVMILPASLKNVAKTIKALASETFSAVSAPIQYAAVKAYSDHTDLLNYRKHTTHILSTVADYCQQRFTQMGINCTAAKGGFYNFIDFTPLEENINQRKIMSSKQLCSELITKASVALLPGQVFGRPENELTARFSFVDFDGSEALYQVTNNHGKIEMASFSSLFPKMVAGLDALENWLNENKVTSA